tara:strand:+ start:6094 stop:6552 length:459 start_codon:yes stop_codon:yes gene_type:complete
MLKLSKKTDYGLIAMQHIATVKPSRAVNTKEIAHQYNIPVELLAKVLQCLAKNGLIMSQNGPKGGYVSREEVTIADVISAIEGPIRITECMHEPNEPCQQLETCNIRSPLQFIQTSFVRLLESMTIEDMAAQNALISIASATPNLMTEGATK